MFLVVYSMCVILLVRVDVLFCEKVRFIEVVCVFGDEVLFVVVILLVVVSVLLLKVKLIEVKFVVERVKLVVVMVLVMVWFEF